MGMQFYISTTFHSKIVFYLLLHSSAIYIFGWQKRTFMATRIN